MYTTLIFLKSEWTADGLIKTLCVLARYGLALKGLPQHFRIHVFAIHLSSSRQMAKRKRNFQTFGYVPVWGYMFRWSVNRTWLSPLSSQKLLSLRVHNIFLNLIAATFLQFLCEILHSPHAFYVYPNYYWTVVDSAFLTTHLTVKMKENRKQ